MLSAAATQALATPMWIDMIAIIVGGISGVLMACERKLDLIGAIGLSMVVGLGGGLIRDTIMQVGNVYMVANPFAIPVSVITAIVVFYFHGPFFKIDSLLGWIDIFAVGLFAASGCDKALAYNMTAVTAIFMGFITGVGGGMLRDALLGEVPQIFRRGNLYAICALLGATTYWLCAGPLTMPKAVAAAACVAVTVFSRRLSIHFNILSPRAIDLTPKIIEPVRRVAKKHKEKKRS